MSKLYRVQDADGRGPYRPGFSHKWSAADGPVCKPWWIELGITLQDGLAMIPDGMFSGSAFRSIHQLADWFTPDERKKLHGLGFVVVRFRPDQIIAETPTQVLFAQNTPLFGLPVCGPLTEMVEA